MNLIYPLLGIISIVLTFIAYIPYVRDILAGSTKPHTFSWIVWAVTTGIIFFLQFEAGGGWGAYITLGLTLIVTFVLILSIRYGTRDIKPVDIVLLVLALCSLPLWLLVDQPLLSMILLISIDVLGFLPTIRKTWVDPYSETLSLYAITAVRYLIAFIALEEFNLITILFPITWLCMNTVFSFIIVIRRRNFSDNRSKMKR